MKTPTPLCDNCGGELYYDADSGLYLHERVNGQQRDLQNGLFCVPEEWGKEPSERRYARPLPLRIPELTPEELAEAGYIKVESMPTPYGYYLWLWCRLLTDEWYAQKSEAP